MSFTPCYSYQKPHHCNYGKQMISYQFYALDSVHDNTIIVLGLNAFVSVGKLWVITFMFMYVNNNALLFPRCISTLNKEYLLFHVENQSCHSKKGNLLFQASTRQQWEKQGWNMCIEHIQIFGRPSEWPKKKKKQGLFTQMNNKTCIIYCCSFSRPGNDSTGKTGL